MSFEVGKKYVGSTDGRVHPEVHECVYKDSKGIVLKSLFSGLLGVHHYTNYGSLYGYFVEYKEPRSISGWVNIWNNGGKLKIGQTIYDTLEDAKKVKWHSDWQRLDSVEVKWTEST